jgi:hypothetical protein
MGHHHFSYLSSSNLGTAGILVGIFIGNAWQENTTIIPRLKQKNAENTTGEQPRRAVRAARKVFPIFHSRQKNGAASPQPRGLALTLALADQSQSSLDWRQ